MPTEMELTLEQPQQGVSYEVSVKMNDLDITMEEYIQLETKKALRRGQVYNSETATYGKIRYFEGIDYFKNFKTEFPAIVYKDGLTSEPEVSPKPTVSLHHVKEVDLQFEISFVESDDEDYTVLYDKDSFSYKIFLSNHLIVLLMLMLIPIPMSLMNTLK
ncbi:hypothetical protein Tco_1507350 [Tanacetum coccineum]